MEEEPEEPEDARPPSSLPTVGEEERGFEYSVQHATLDEVASGAPLAERLNQASADGWDLVSILDAGEQKAIVLRRRRRPTRESRLVGFAPQRS